VKLAGNVGECGDAFSIASHRSLPDAAANCENDGGGELHHRRSIKIKMPEKNKGRIGCWVSSKQSGPPAGGVGTSVSYLSTDDVIVGFQTRQRFI
jgi:hypothetical protein